MGKRQIIKKNKSRVESINKIIFKILLGLFLCNCSFFACSSKNELESGEIVPSELNFSHEVLHSNNDYPNGNGSGLIEIIANAEAATRYKITYGNEVENSTGQASHTYKYVGTKTYTVSVVAYSSTNNSISDFKTITMYVKEPELNLVWSDEFDTDGAIDTSKWFAEIIPPDNETNWWNGEKQHYTDRLDNVYISDGTLKIVAKKEDYTFITSRNESITKEYTSARIKTQDKYEFTYGRIDVKAKLPQGEGTWPAIWMLGANIDSVNWPACGEIDIMEHWGHNASIVASATHNTACYGGCANVTVGETTLPDYATNFHVYSLVWTEEELRFLIDDELKYKYKPNTKNNNNWPYTKDQFIILNLAMGGDWFTIDPNFSASTMEIDYVRVYQ